MEKDLGWGNGYIGSIKKDLPADRLRMAAEYLDVSPDFLLTGEVPKEECGRSVPLYEHVVADAGASMNAMPAGTMELAPSDGYDYFAVRVKGNSMYSKIADGDIVVVRKQNDVESGEIAVVAVNGEEATVKQIIKSEAGVTLVGFNAVDFTPAFYSNEEIAKLPVNVLGKAIKVVADL